MAELGLQALMRQDAPIPLDAEIACSPGEALALVGPSGSGKSTILRTIAGLYRPRRARVMCNGATWLDTERGIDLPPHARAVGLVFQSYALFPHMSALQNVAAALGHIPRRERKEKARVLLASLHLNGLGRRKPAELSGGEQQRVAVARALARDPQALLLDEPFSAVDKSTRQALYRELAELRQRLAMPLVLVTHDFDEAARLADRLCLLAHGRIIQTGSPSEVLTRPASIEAARLLDIKNVFEGRVAGQEPDTTLVDWNGLRVRARAHNAFASGDPVMWTIPATQVVLRAPGAASGRDANVVSGTVRELVNLSESTALTLAVEGQRTALLSATAPAHVSQGMAVAPGSLVTVSLLKEGIHLMPAARQTAR